MCPGHTAVVQQLWRRDVTSPFPPSGNGGYASNRDVPYQSVTFDVTSELGWMIGQGLGRDNRTTVPLSG